MPNAYCTRCRTNWAALSTQDDEDGDESYEFCPHCKTDSYLKAAKENEPLVNHCIGKTPQHIIEAVKLPPSKRFKRTLSHEQRTALNEAKESAQEKRINEYIANCERYGKEEAERIYLATPLIANYKTDLNTMFVQ